MDVERLVGEEGVPVIPAGGLHYVIHLLNTGTTPVVLPYSAPKLHRWGLRVAGRRATDCEPPEPISHAPADIALDPGETKAFEFRCTSFGAGSQPRTPPPGIAYVSASFRTFAGDTLASPSSITAWQGQLRTQIQKVYVKRYTPVEPPANAVLSRRCRGPRGRYALTSIELDRSYIVGGAPGGGRGSTKAAVTVRVTNRDAARPIEFASWRMIIRSPEGGDVALTLAPRSPKSGEPWRRVVPPREREIVTFGVLVANGAALAALREDVKYTVIVEFVQRDGVVSWVRSAPTALRVRRDPRPRA